MAVLLALVLFVLVKMKMVEADVNAMFSQGQKSLYQIAVLLGVFSLIYPKFGYTTRSVSINGEMKEFRGTLDEVMESRGYRLEKEDENGICFVKRSPLDRVLRVWEDRITITPILGGITLEGRTKDLARLISVLQYKFKETQEDE